MKDNLRNKRRGIATAATGIACNVMLAAVKIAVGFTAGMISVVADGFNNLGDCGSGIVSLISVSVAAKPADKVHPYGHRRAEYIAAMITGFLVLVVAAELLNGSVVGIVDGALNATGWVVYTVLGVSVAVKAAMFVFYRVAARRIGSDSLKAAATDSLCDCISTAAVIVGAVLSEFGIAADGWAGVAVSLFVGWQGINIVRDAGSKLLGQAPDERQVNRIKALIWSGEGVLGLHDLHIFCYGNGVAYATVHVEMDADLTSSQAHAVIDEIEHRVLAEEGVELTAHLDPVDTRDEQAILLEKTLRNALDGIVDGLEIHDFRLIRGAVDKMVFDAGIPFDCKLSDADVEHAILAAVRKIGDYEAAVTVERE